MHKFKVGQVVRIVASFTDKGLDSDYTVMALLPDDRGDNQYRVQSTSNTQQRVVVESRLTPLDAL